MMTLPNFEVTTVTKPFFSARLSLLPPGVNKSYKIVTIHQGGRSFSRLAATPELEQFKEAAAWELKQATVDRQLVEAIKASKLKTPLALSLKFYFSTLWKRDIDGPEKAVQDVVFKYLELNDNLIVEKHTTKEIDSDPHVEIELRCIVAR